MLCWACGAEVSRQLLKDGAKLPHSLHASNFSFIHLAHRWPNASSRKHVTWPRNPSAPAPRHQRAPGRAQALTCNKVLRSIISILHKISRQLHTCESIWTHIANLLVYNQHEVLLQRYTALFSMPTISPPSSCCPYCSQALSRPFPQPHVSLSSPPSYPPDPSLPAPCAAHHQAANS